MSRYPSFKRPVQNINGRLYVIHAEYPMDRVKDVRMVKEWLGVDTVFTQHSSGTYWFCEIIEDIDWEMV